MQTFATTRLYSIEKHYTGVLKYIFRLYTLNRITSMLCFFFKCLHWLFSCSFVLEAAGSIHTDSVWVFVSYSNCLSAICDPAVNADASGLLFPANYILILMILFGILVKDFLLTLRITFMCSYVFCICNWR